MTTINLCLSFFSLAAVSPQNISGQTAHLLDLPAAFSLL
jgi:hypothetical protein